MSKMKSPPLAATAPILGVLLLLVSCVSGPGGHSAGGLDTGGRAPQPTAQLAARAGEDLDTIGTGYWVFQRKCLECHEARVPRDPSNSNWHPVLRGMSWNAGLSDSEQDAVMAYLRAAGRSRGGR